MPNTTLKTLFVAVILASALPLAACDDSPTSPTQPGPAVSGPIVSITGQVFNLARSGPGDLNISFRIDDFTIVRATAATPVDSSGRIFRTDAVRNGQRVIAEGRRTNGFLDATKITIIALSP